MNITHFDLTASSTRGLILLSALFTVLCQAFSEVFLFQDVYQDFAASILQVCDTPYDPRCVCMCSDVNQSTVHLSVSLSVHLSVSLCLWKSISSFTPLSLALDTNTPATLHWHTLQILG